MCKRNMWVNSSFYLIFCFYYTECVTHYHMDLQSCNCNKETCIKTSFIITLDFTKMHRCDLTTLLSSYKSWFFFPPLSSNSFLNIFHVSQLRSQFLSEGKLITLLSSLGHYLSSPAGLSNSRGEWLMLN